MSSKTRAPRSKAETERRRLALLPDVWKIDSRHGDIEVVDGVEYTFDARAADRAVDFFHLFLTHIKGELAGKPLILARWQRLVVRRLFGWKRPDGKRRYRTLFLFVPRKNGKSTFAAGLELYMMIADGEQGAQVYCAASDKEQAALTFDDAKAMVENSPDLRSRVTSFKRSMAVVETRSRLIVLSGKPSNKHGFNVHCAGIDELHAHPNRDLYDVLVTGMGARSQPMAVITTTAGFDQHSICYEVYSYARKVNAGEVVDATFLPVMFELEAGADWTNEDNWAKANPNLGVSISWEFLRSEYAKARATPGYENTFRRLYLNQWTEQATRWLSVITWRACAGPISAREPTYFQWLLGRACYAGVDISSTRDLTALVGVFPDAKTNLNHVLARFWLPKETVQMRARRDKVPYPQWVRDGYIIETEGSATDQNAVRLEILKWREIFDLRDVAVDRWEAGRLIGELEDEGVEAFAHGQGYQSMSMPSKELERVLVDGRIVHGGNPVLEWCVGNAAIKTDPAGNIKPAKDKSSDRIDGLVALIMGLGRAMLGGDERSVYSRRGGGLQSI